MALPTSIDPASPAGSDALSSGDDHLRAIRQFLVDVFGLVSSPTQITAAPFSITAAGIVTLAQGLVSVPLTNLAGNPATLGQIARNADILKYHDGTGVQFINFGQLIRKSAAETVNTSTTLQDDDTLLFNIGASEVWRAQWAINFNSNATAGFKIAIVAPTGATGQWDGIYQTNDGVTGVVKPILPSSTLDGSAPKTLSVIDGTSYMAYVNAIIVNSTNAGNLKLQWAQGSASGATTVDAGSTLVAQRIV